MTINQHDLDQHQLDFIRRERDALMHRINAIDRIEVNLIKMMGSNIKEEVNRE